MSHQFSFYALPADLAVVEQRLRALEPLFVLHCQSPTAAPRVVPSLDLIENGYRQLSFYLVRAADLDAVVTDHIPEQGYWLVDHQLSPVIEAGACFHDGHLVRLSRFYYVDEYYVDDFRVKVEKPSDFRRWAKRVFQVAKRAMPRQGTVYVGPEAARWRADGGIFVDGTRVVSLPN